MHINCKFVYIWILIEIKIEKHTYQQIKYLKLIILYSDLFRTIGVIFLKGVKALK